MRTETERKGRGRKWAVRGALLVIIILLLLKCSGKPGPLLSGDGGKPPSQERQAIDVAIPASVPVVSSVNNESAIPKRGKPEGVKGDLGVKVQKKTRMTTGSEETGSHTVRTDPGLADEGKQSAGTLPDQTAAGKVMLEGEPQEPDLEGRSKSERLEQQKAQTETVEKKEKRQEEPAALSHPADTPHEVLPSQTFPGERAEVEQTRIQTGLNPEDRPLQSPVQKATAQTAENSPLKQEERREEFPGESSGYPEGDFIEVAIQDAEYVPICPGDPSAEGLAAKVEDSPGKTFTDPVTGMSFVLVKGGCFNMGSNTGGSDEKPVHEVCVDDFYMGEYEVTQAQYEWIMRHNPSSFPRCDLPVESVSWEDVQVYIRKLSQASGRNYRLPSEAEWEYAARSGWKDEAEAAIDESLLMEYGGYIRNIGNQTDSVGPNGLGLYDMTGNVWEWVSDWYGAKYYADSPRTNPRGPQSGLHRVLRAGTDGRHELQFAKRYGAAPNESHNYFGFRVVFPARIIADGQPEAQKPEISDSAGPISRDEVPALKVEPASGPSSIQSPT